MDDEDIRDAMLFRFWCRAASYPGGWPGELMKALQSCHKVEEYRAALMVLARQKGVNLP